MISPYFTIDSTMEVKFLYGTVVRTMLLYSIQALVSDGESANLSLMKMLCRYVDESTDAISPWFTSQCDGGKVNLIVFLSHQVS